MRRGIVLTMLVVLGLACAQAGTIYVSPDGTGSGADWANATSLTNALRINQANDSIWLAQGTYTNTATFTIASNNIALYGGFTNGMATLEERNWTNYLTILDGKAQDRRVVTVSGANVLLDGVIITNSYGAAAGGLTKTTAGALTVANCRLVNHEGRTTDMRGIGASFTGGPVLLTNCVVANNTISGSAWNGQGFGIYAKGADLQVVDCLFTNQYGNYNETRAAMGLGLYFDQGNLQVLRSSFINNSGGANNGGGGSAICLGSNATFSATISNCIFRGNVGLYLNANNSAGAALWADLGAGKTATVVNCTFRDNNNQEGDGGAIRLSGGTLVLKNSILWTNVASQTARYGHEINVAGGTLLASHCLLGGLSTPQIYVSGGSVTLSNCATNNPLYASATDLHVKSAAGRWDGSTWVTTDTVYSPAIDACDPTDSVGLEPAENGGRRNLGAYGGTDQASKSPAAVAPQVANRSLSAEYTRLTLSGELTNSAAVIATVGICYGRTSISGETTNGWEVAQMFYPPQQTGAVFSLTTPYLLTDTTYFYRCFATNAHGSSWAPVDSYTTGSEYPPYWGVGGGSNVIHVRAGAVGEADGRDWYNAYTTIGAGLAAISGTRTNVWISGGTYSEGISRTVATNATIIGGFAGTETSVVERAASSAGVATNHTAMNGAGTYRCLAVTGGDVWLDTMCFSNSPTGRALSKSGNGALVVNNCRFEKNYGDNTASGGGAYLSGGTVRMIGCQIVSNQCDSSGVGLYFSGSTVLMTNCVVAGNRHGFNNPEGAHSQVGMGVYASGCAMEIVDCVFRDQIGHVYGSRTGRGGGLAFDGGTLRVSRCEFTGNRNVGSAYAGNVGGGAGVFLGSTVGQSAAFSNCLFRANEVMRTSAGGGGNPGAVAWGAAVQARLHSASTAAFVNCTFAYNTNDCGYGGAVMTDSGRVVLKNCVLWTNQSVDTYYTNAGYEVYATNAAAVVPVSYSDFTGTNAPQVVAVGGATVTLGDGMLTIDPLFASATNLHLKSKGGRWDPVGGTWVRDSVTSPCIDAGDPSDSVRDEPQPNGRKVNMGAYGGTAQASKTLLSGTLLMVR